MRPRVRLLRRAARVANTLARAFDAAGRQESAPAVLVLVLDVNSRPARKCPESKRAVQAFVVDGGSVAQPGRLYGRNVRSAPHRHGRAGSKNITHRKQLARMPMSALAFASFWASASHFRSTANNGSRQTASACRKSAQKRSFHSTDRRAPRGMSAMANSQHA
jgi:hypothetical protein